MTDFASYKGQDRYDVVRYSSRTADGSCNNPNSKYLGAAMTPFTRFLPPRYNDGTFRINTLLRLRSHIVA